MRIEIRRAAPSHAVARGTIERLRRRFGGGLGLRPLARCRACGVSIKRNSMTDEVGTNIRAYHEDT